jgi:hypothetical protein
MNNKIWVNEELMYLSEHYGNTSVDEIAQYLRRSRNSVMQRANKLGLKSVRTWSNEEDTVLKKYFLTAPFSFYQEQLNNRSVSSIRNRASFLRLTGKIKIKTKCLYTVDHNYFASYTLQSCYWAGFLAADGWIYKSTIGCKLSYKDVFHLENFKQEVHNNSNIKISSSISFGKLHTSATLLLYSPQLVADLNKYFNITQKKTFTLKPPLIDDMNHKLAFICGLLDGDGTTYSINGNIRCTFLGNFKMMSWVKSTLMLFNNIESSAQVTPKGNIWSYSIGNTPSRRLISWIQENHLYTLPRKLGKYGKFI